jgi:hypothetical protein
MNEKRNRTFLYIAFVALSAVLAFFIGFNLGNTGTGTTDYGDEARRIISELRDGNAELRANLDSVFDDLRAANELTRELRDGNRRAVEITLRSDERFADFERAVDGTTDLIERIERRQQRIDELVVAQRSDNRELRNTLGFSNPEY